MDNATLEVIAIIFGMAIQTWLIIRYLLDRMDKKTSDETAARQKLSDQVFGELNKIKDTHVRKDDFHRTVDNFEKQFTNLNAQITSLGNAIGGRLDNLMMLIKFNKGDNPNDHS